MADAQITEGKAAAERLQRLKAATPHLRESRGWDVQHGLDGVLRLRPEGYFSAAELRALADALDPPPNPRSQ